MSDSHWRVGAGRAVGLGLALVWAVTFVSTRERPVLVEEEGFSVRVSNPYERRLGRKIGDGLYPFGLLVDVSQKTKFEAASAVRWEIEGVASTETLSEVEVKFPHPGDFRLATTDGSGKVVMEETVHVRVVRRELRELTTEEVSDYFDALHVLYTIDDVEGKSKFGADYVSAFWLIREHLYGAAQRDCDHWHDDAGIMNHHVGVTWEFEKALRVVNGETAAHYWDYVLDAKVFGTSVETMTKSPIFGDSWFGGIPNEESSHVLAKGRWAYTPIMANARSYSNITNPYGLLRSPWNTNKIPFVLRSQYTLGQRGANFQLPSCSDFQSYLTSKVVQLSDVLSALNGALHGPVHIMVGGHWGDQKPIWNHLATHTDQSMSQLLLFSKFMWRQGYVRCPEKCSTDAPQDQCMCSCPADIVRGRNAREVLEAVGGLNSDMPFLEYWELSAEATGGDQDVTYQNLLNALCHVGFPGEMFTSAAPQDPIFWPLHGNAERFLQYVRLMKHSGMIDLDETWDYAHLDDVASDTGVVCDWDNVGGMDLPNCVRATCPGHHEDDLLPFTDLLDGQLMTNKEFYFNISTPFADSRLDYVYNSLSYWPGCDNNTLYTPTLLLLEEEEVSTAQTEDEEDTTEKEIPLFPGQDFWIYKHALAARTGESDDLSTFAFEILGYQVEKEDIGCHGIKTSVNTFPPGQFQLHWVASTILANDPIPVDTWEQFFTDLNGDMSEFNIFMHNKVTMFVLNITLMSDKLKEMGTPTLRRQSTGYTSGGSDCALGHVIFQLAGRAYEFVGALATTDDEEEEGEEEDLRWWPPWDASECPDAHGFEEKDLDVWVGQYLAAGASCDPNCTAWAEERGFHPPMFAGGSVGITKDSLGATQGSSVDVLFKDLEYLAALDITTSSSEGCTVFTIPTLVAGGYEAPVKYVVNENLPGQADVEKYNSYIHGVHVNATGSDETWASWDHWLDQHFGLEYVGNNSDAIAYALDQYLPGRPVGQRTAYPNWPMDDAHSDLHWYVGYDGPVAWEWWVMAPTSNYSTDQMAILCSCVPENNLNIYQQRTGATECTDMALIQNLELDIISTPKKNNFAFVGGDFVLYKQALPVSVGSTSALAEFAYEILGTDVYRTDIGCKGMKMSVNVNPSGFQLHFVESRILAADPRPIQQWQDYFEDLNGDLSSFNVFMHNKVTLFTTQLDEMKDKLDAMGKPLMLRRSSGYYYQGEDTSLGHVLFALAGRIYELVGPTNRDWHEWSDAECPLAHGFADKRLDSRAEWFREVNDISSKSQQWKNNRGFYPPMFAGGSVLIGASDLDDDGGGGISVLFQDLANVAGLDVHATESSSDGCTVYEIPTQVVGPYSAPVKYVVNTNLENPGLEEVSEYNAYVREIHDDYTGKDKTWHMWDHWLDQHFGLEYVGNNSDYVAGALDLYLPGRPVGQRVGFPGLPYDDLDSAVHWYVGYAGPLTWEYWINTGDNYNTTTIAELCSCIPENSLELYHQRTNIGVCTDSGLLETLDDDGTASSF
ncbi:hypothetical protein CTAYLR_001690 [Chrysophaeum taylorii]|uniref:Tyrosinase copper-binding domain-containing protein n=1 Tax=Chrysophaeum taylorii TaxID=2483200 RepID=A0AAD7U5E6_9STRA|nr:hypothetical protein CTAYLR_001690 [Chrysophaeum taylorii]